MPLNYSSSLKYNSVFESGSDIKILYCNVTEDKDCIDLNNQTNKE